MATERDNRAKYARDAASLILLRRSGGEPEVLMGRRPTRQTFMPDMFVFPGGAVDRADGFVETARGYHPDVEQALTRHCTAHRARAIGLAAIRETFEETGLMFGEPGRAFAATPPAAWQAFAAARVMPRLDGLGFIARAITPKGPPRRFHARFFVGDARHLQGEMTGSAELLDLGWFPLREAAKLPIAAVTELVLKEAAMALARQPETDADRGIPVFSRRLGKRVIRYEMGSGRIVRGMFEGAAGARPEA